MTGEQFIELKTAKLAKQAGFDWECRYYIDLWASPTLFDDKTGEMQYELKTGTDFRNDIVPKNYNSTGAFVSIPTQAVLQRWLREVKGMSVEVYHEIVWVEGGILGIKWTYSVCHLNSNESDLLPSNEFDTYEAALEAGLQECLTILIEKQ